MKSKFFIPIFIILGITLVVASFVSAETNDGVILYPLATSGSACIGSEITYSFQITNNTPTTLIMELSYTSNWPYTGPTITPSILPGAVYPFLVKVYIPWTVNPGEFDILTLTGIGGGYSVSATATTTSNIIQDWEDYTNTPRGTRWSSVVYYDGNLYKIGGEYSGAQAWLDIYNIATGFWTSGADMPGPRFGMDCEAIAGKIYCGGGSSGTVQSNLFIYDIDSDQWSTGVSLPYAVFGYASAMYHDKYYIIGGNLSSLSTPIYTNKILVYDPVNFTWNETSTPMSIARSWHSSGVVGDKIIVAGGYNGVFLSSAEVYDPDLDSWTSIASLPAPRVNAADGVNADRFLVLAGGSSESLYSSSDTAFIYDAKTNNWQWLPDMDHAIYGAEGDSDGENFWLVSGRIFTTAWTYSIYTTLMNACAATCPSPVTGADFSWTPSPTPWTGSTVNFTATVTSGSSTINYIWDFGDNSSGAGSPIDHIFSASLTYTVELTATNCDGASSSTISHPVTIIDPPTVDTIPEGLDAAQLINTTTVKQLEICNLGDAELTWNLSESDILPLQNIETNQTNYYTADIPWLSESLVSGTIPGDTCVPIDIFFNSNDLEENIYLGSLIITSNDPSFPTKNLPVSLTVTTPSIELTKTISLVQNVCGTTNHLNVYANTTVYYCYTATNTGGILFDTHNLADDQLGELLNAYSFTLTPGASISIISNGVEITEAVTNEAVWTARYGDLNASDISTATITIIPDPDVWIYLPTILKVPVK